MSWMMDYTKAELFEMGQREGLSCFPVNTVADVYTTEQYKARGFFEEGRAPAGRDVSLPGSSIQDNRPSARAAPARALLGQHNTEVYVEMLKRSLKTWSSCARQG